MSLVRHILGKELFELTKGDLVDFFKHPREETSILEFKSGEVKINGVFKEICAFLNTEGGIIIIGSPKEQKIPKTGKRICRGKLIPSGFRDKDWLYSLVSANIVPEPKELKIHEIADEQGKYFVIEVPQSQKPPHQFLTDGRYYIRMNLEAKPAPHGIVESLFLKSRKPMLHAIFNINRPNKRKGTENFNNLKIDIANQSSIPTTNISYLIRLMNIEDIRHNGTVQSINQDGEGNYEIKGTSDEVLVDERKFPLHFDVINKMEPYLVSVMVWNSEAGLFKVNALFDPMNFQYIEKYETGDQDLKNVDQLYSTLLDIKENLT